MSFNILPPELIACVVANIESQPTLCNLARCSRQFYICTIPRLYHSPHVTIQENSREQNAQLQNLASVLIRRPDLAGLVRCFTLHDRSELSIEEEQLLYSRREPEETEESEHHVTPATVEVDHAFKTAVNALSLSKEEENRWLRKLSLPHKCHADLFLALLLPALLKVEELYLDLKFGFYLEQVIRRAARRESPFDIEPAFEALAVFVHGQELRPFIERSAGFIASLLKLPAIRIISGSFGSLWDNDFDGEKSLMELDSSSSSVTNIGLFDYSLTTTNLAHVLRVPKALQTFSYRSDNIKFIEIRHALGPQEKSLESIGFEDCHLDDFHHPMTSFISFNALQVFKTPTCSLLTTDNGTERHRLINVFPPNLETLHLTRCEQETCESLLELLEAVEYLLAQKSPLQIPSLKTLIIGDSNIGHPLWRDQHETAIERLSKLAGDRGVCVKWGDDIYLGDSESSMQLL